MLKNTECLQYLYTLNTMPAGQLIFLGHASIQYTVCTKSTSKDFPNCFATFGFQHSKEVFPGMYSSSILPHKCLQGLNTYFILHS